MTSCYITVRTTVDSDGEVAVLRCDWLPPLLAPSALPVPPATPRTGAA